MKIIGDLRRTMGLSSDSREGGVLAALGVGTLAGAFTAAGWLFGFELAGPQRSQSEYWSQQPAPPLHPDEPCIPVPCDPAVHSPHEVCCQLTEADRGAYIGPAFLYAPPADIPAGAGAPSEVE